MIGALIATGLFAGVVFGIRALDRWSYEHRKPEKKKEEKPKAGVKGEMGRLYRMGADMTVSQVDINDAIRWMKRSQPFLSSPLPKIVSDEAWDRYVRARCCGEIAGRKGPFAFSEKRLTDLGEKEPSDMEGWYRLLQKSDVDYMDDIIERHDDDFDQPGFAIEGKPITLSGLLSVAHFAGIDGMTSWLESERDRKKFRATTQAFQATNGLF